MLPRWPRRIALLEGVDAGGVVFEPAFELLLLLLLLVLLEGALDELPLLKWACVCGPAIPST
ncbi:hypothetical protein JCM19046_4207 [Bacillus sp. JCM 19046]|nr:hypothetical protein JCM19046_4207 [Bacillus sp. JCM 19046]